MPYLYAVEDANDIPLFADPKMVGFLRDRYRRRHLEAVAPDLGDGGTPGGNWYQLVGSAYDRTSYAYRIETSPEQDLALIRAYNSSQNRSHFRTLSSNCADFAKGVINFYYPHALHRSVVADIGITTPKQTAETMVKFHRDHPGLPFARYVIPQVPGIEARSTPVHGVVESFFKSKKYIVPSALVSPIFAGCVAAVYVGTEETSRFNPSREALVFQPGRELQAPVDEEDRRSYQSELRHREADGAFDAGGVPWGKNLARMLDHAAPGVDVNGSPILRVDVDGKEISLGVSRRNIGLAGLSRPLAQRLLEARLREELRRGNPPKVSAADVERDWALLEKAGKGADVGKTADKEVASQTTPVWHPVSLTPSGNRP
jgi:hypothetical protein